MQGRIVKALSGFYYVYSDGRIIQCRGRGVFRLNKVTPLVGDLVTFEAENDEEGYILEVHERKNELIRPPISNVDQALLVFSAIEPQFSPVLLDRFLVLIEANAIKPIICISKIDLMTDEQLSEQLHTFISDYEKIGYTVLRTSITSTKDFDQLKSLLDGRITVVAGQSGVGKSSLLNTLLPDLQLKTDDISSHLGRGKHTTRHVELIQIGNGLVADTPGFSSLEFSNIEIEELNHCFPEIQDISAQCKFRGCLHVSEPKCAVKQSVDTGEIAKFRYDNYVAFLEEIKDRKPRY